MAASARYSAHWVKERWDVKAGAAAEQHAAESGHDGHFLLTYSVVSCAHLGCEPQWEYRLAAAQDEHVEQL